MTKLLLILMMVGLWSGCGEDSDGSTGPSEEITTGPQGQTLEIQTEEWKNGDIKVEFQYYRDGGSVIKHGFYKEYDDDGTLRVDGTYYKDKEKHNGMWVEYSDGGQLKSQGNYKDGDEEGYWVWYYDESEKVKYEANFVDGKREGKWIRNYRSGNLGEEGNFIDGEEDGKWVYYYESGKVEREGNFINGKEEGKWVWYEEEGNITDEDIWKDGECVEMCEGDE